MQVNFHRVGSLSFLGPNGERGKNSAFNGSIEKLEINKPQTIEISAKAVDRGREKDMWKAITIQISGDELSRLITFAVKQRIVTLPGAAGVSAAINALEKAALQMGVKD